MREYKIVVFKDGNLGYRTTIFHGTDVGNWISDIGKEIRGKVGEIAQSKIGKIVIPMLALQGLGMITVAGKPLLGAKFASATSFIGKGSASTFGSKGFVASMFGKNKIASTILTTGMAQKAAAGGVTYATEAGAAINAQLDREEGLVVGQNYPEYADGDNGAYSDFDDRSYDAARDQSLKAADAATASTIVNAQLKASDSFFKKIGGMVEAKALGIVQTFIEGGASADDLRQSGVSSKDIGVAEALKAQYDEALAMIRDQAISNQNAYTGQGAYPGVESTSSVTPDLNMPGPIPVPVRSTILGFETSTVAPAVAALFLVAILIYKYGYQTPKTKAGRGR